MFKKRTTIAHLFIGSLFLLFLSLSLATYSYESIRQDEALKNIRASQKIREAEDILIQPKAIQSVAEEPRASAPVEDHSFVYNKNPNLTYLQINSDYIGWITIEGTRIDFPIVRGKDNQYYLDHDFYQSENKYGAIFMDYRNLGNFLDAHTIIYGHTLKDDEMFADLKNYLSQDFLLNHAIITLEGLYETKEYEIISVYEEKASEIDINLQSVDQAYIETLIEQSLFDLEPIKTNGKLLTLATCTYSIEDGRLIIHALER